MVVSIEGGRASDSVSNGRSREPRSGWEVGGADRAVMVDVGKNFEKKQPLESQFGNLKITTLLHIGFKRREDSN